MNTELVPGRTSVQASSRNLGFLKSCSSSAQVSYYCTGIHATKRLGDGGIRREWKQRPLRTVHQISIKPETPSYSMVALALHWIVPGARKHGEFRGGPY